jgi:photosystem II stability/assembly factor-like uncharacterized protein
VARIAHHPTTTNLLLVAQDSVIYRTTNGGTNWNVVLTDPTRTICDVKFASLAPFTNRVMAGTTGPNGKLYLSTDAGLTWTDETGPTIPNLPNDGGRIEVAFGGTGNVLWASVDKDGGELWRSTDGGASWVPRNTTSNYLCSGPNCQGWLDNAIWGSVDPNLVVVGGIDLFRSTDGGATLEKISDWLLYHQGLSAHADQHVILPHPNYNGGTNKTVFVANDGGVQLTTDILGFFPSGIGWSNLANNLGITQFYAGASSPTGGTIMGGAQDNGNLRYRSIDGAQEWLQCLSCTGDGMSVAINPSNPNIIYTATQNLVIAKSTDGGGIYLPATNGCGDCGDENNTRFRSVFTMDPNDPDNLVAGGSTVWRTTNAADQWVAIRTPIGGGAKVSTVAVAPGNSNLIWAGYDNGTIARTSGVSVFTWVTVDDNGASPPPDGGVVMDIAINPDDADEVFVALGGYFNQQVWRTTNNGSTWALRTGAVPIPAVQVNAVAFHPVNTNWVYLGTDLCVFASEDKGATWSVTPRYPGTEGPVNVIVSDLFFQGTNDLVAATFGRGMWRTPAFNTLYVDGAWSGPESGRITAPYNTVLEANSNSGPGTTISIKAGTYNEPALTFDKRGTLIATNGDVRIE